MQSDDKSVSTDKKCHGSNDTNRHGGSVVGCHHIKELSLKNINKEGLKNFKRLKASIDTKVKWKHEVRL